MRKIMTGHGRVHLDHHSAVELEAAPAGLAILDITRLLTNNLKVVICVERATWVPHLCWGLNW